MPYLVDSNAKGEVRGYVLNPQTHFDLNEHGKLDVRRAVGTTGTLTVVKILVCEIILQVKFRLFQEN